MTIRRGPIEPLEAVLLIDEKGRHYLVKLVDGGSFQYHHGGIAHADIIGRDEGDLLLTGSGGRLRLLRPRLADYTLKMPRGAQIVYPKDAGSILAWGDIAAGMTVVEAGTGSGALTISLLRAVGSDGRVVSFDVREDHQAHAVKSVKRWFGTIPDNLELRVGDVAEGIDSIAADRVVLDLPEPWHAIDGVERGLRGGIVLTCYLPTVPQLQTLTDRLRESSRWEEIDVFETMHRSWNVEGRSVRPSHQMVGHTGFIVTARLVAAPS